MWILLIRSSRAYQYVLRRVEYPIRTAIALLLFSIGVRPRLHIMADRSDSETGGSIICCGYVEIDSCYSYAAVYFNLPNWVARRYAKACYLKCHGLVL